MNWLAHVHLSEPEAEYRVGNVIADWVKGEARKSLAPGIWRGLACHREIDLYTDAHSTAKRSAARIRPPYRRYAAVLVDVFYDHFLAADWERYSPVELTAFTRAVYADFATVWDSLDERVRWGLRRMAEEDWLASYASLDGIDVILKRMSRRLSRPNLLGESLPELLAHYESLREDFHEFYPQLQSHIARWQEAQGQLPDR